MSDGIDHKWDSTTNLHRKKGCRKQDKIQKAMREVERNRPRNPHSGNLVPDELAKIVGMKNLRK